MLAVLGFCLSVFVLPAGGVRTLLRAAGQGGDLRTPGEGAGCFHPGACPANTVDTFTPTPTPTPTPTAQPAIDSESASIAATALPRPEEGQSALGPSSPIAQSMSASISFNSDSVARDQLSILHAVLTAPSALASASSVPNSQGLGASVAVSLVQTPGLGAVFASAKGVPPEATLSIIVGTQSSSPAASQASPGGYIKSASAAVINGVSTDLPAARTVTVNLHTPEVISVGSEALTLQPVSPNAVPVENIAPQASATPQYIAHSQTIVPGGSVVGSSTFTPNASFEATSVTVGTQVITANPTAFRIAGTTVSAGGPGINIDNTLISLQPSGSGLVIGSSTVSLPTASQPAPTTIKMQILTLSPTGYTVGGTTISAGGHGITIAGIYVSLASNGDLIVGGSIISATSSEPTASASDGNLSMGTSNSAANTTRSKPSDSTPIQTPSGSAGVSVLTSSSTKTAASKASGRLRSGMHEVIAALVGGVVGFTLL